MPISDNARTGAPLRSVFKAMSRAWVCRPLVILLVLQLVLPDLATWNGVLAFHRCPHKTARIREAASSLIGACRASRTIW